MKKFLMIFLCFLFAFAFAGGSAVLLSGCGAQTEDVKEGDENVEITPTASGYWTDPGYYDGSGYAGGNGTSSSPYLISTAAQLARLAYYSNYGSSYCASGTYYKLTADIDLSAHYWVSIGKSYSFRGNFDGNGHVISGLTLYLASATSSYNSISSIGSSTYGAGFFGYLNGGRVSNLIFRNVSLTTASVAQNNNGYYFGILASRVYNSDITQVGVVSGTTRLSFSSFNIYNFFYGGLIGSAESSNITRCFCSINMYTNGNLRNTANYSAKYAGGLVGRFAGDSYGVYDSYFYGHIDIYGMGYVGGIVGYTNTDNIDIMRCYFHDTGTAWLGCQYAGGIVGYTDFYDDEEEAYYATITSCFTDSKITVNSNTNVSTKYIGAIVGYNDGYVTASCWNSSKTSAGHGDTFVSSFQNNTAFTSTTLPVSSNGSAFYTSTSYLAKGNGSAWSIYSGTTTASTSYTWTKYCGSSTYLNSGLPVLTWSLKYVRTYGYANSSASSSSNYATVALVSGSPAVTTAGGATYYRYALIGVDVTYTAKTLTGYTFNNWRYGSGSGTVVSTSATFTTFVGGQAGVASVAYNMYACYNAYTYTIAFDKNGGDSGQGDIAAVYGVSYTFPTATSAGSAINFTSFTKTGYTLSKWNTATDGSGTSYTPGSSYSNLTSTDEGFVRLYAIWTINTYTISFDAGTGGTGTMGSFTVRYGTDYSVTNEFTASAGYAFAGWKIEGMDSGVTHYYGASTSTYSSTTSTSATYSGTGDMYFMNLRSTSGTVTLTAQWRALRYTWAVYVNSEAGLGTGEYTHDSTSQLGGKVYVSYGTPVGTESVTVYGSKAGPAQQQKQFQAVATASTGYVFTGFTTSSTAPSPTSAPASTYTVASPNSNVTLYAWFRKVSGNQLKYDSAENYWYFEDGEYPQSTASFKWTTAHTGDIIVSANGDTQEIVLNGTWTGGRGVVLFEVWGLNFVQGQQYFFQVELLSGKASLQGAQCFHIDVCNSSGSCVSTRNYVDHGGVLTINSAGASEGVGIKASYWMNSDASATFENARYRISVSYDSILESALSAGSLTKNYDINYCADSGTEEQTFTGSNYVALGRSQMYTDKITVNLWAYMDNWSNYNGNSMTLISCTEGGGWNLGDGGSGDYPLYPAFAMYDSGVGYKTVKSSTKYSSISSGWHMFTMTFDGKNLRGYLDGVLFGTSAAFSSGKIGYNSSNGIFIGAEAGATTTSPLEAYFQGKIKGVSIQNMALSTDQISLLYSSNTISIPVYTYNGVKYARAAIGRWFKVEPIRWVVGYGSSAPSGWTNYGATKTNFDVVSAKVIAFGAVNAGHVKEGWSYSSSSMYSNINASSTKAGLEYSATKSVTNDSFTSAGSQVVVTRGTVSSSGLRVASVSEIRNIGTVVPKYSDMVAFLVSGGTSTTSTGSEFVEYWTRDLANPLGSPLSAQLDAGITIDKFGPTTGTWLQNALGVRLAMTMREGTRY